MAERLRESWWQRGEPRWLDSDTAPAGVIEVLGGFAAEVARRLDALDKLYGPLSALCRGREKNNGGLGAAAMRLVTERRHKLAKMVRMLAFAVPGGFLARGCRAAKTAFPVSLAVEVQLVPADGGCGVILRPVGAPKVSKPNLGVDVARWSNKNPGDEDDKLETLAENYDGNGAGDAGGLTLDIGIWFKHLEGCGDEVLFKDDRLVQVAGWDAAIDWLAGRQEFMAAEMAFDDALFLFDPKDEVRALYEGYASAAETLVVGSANDLKHAQGSALGRMLAAMGPLGITASRAPTVPGDTRPDTPDLVCGMLREQIGAAVKGQDGSTIADGGHYGLNREQRDFCTKTLAADLANHDGRSEVYAIALNGPPGTGKTTALQTLVASEVVHAALAGKAPRIIFGASATHQAKTNMINGFRHGEVHKGGGAGIRERWIGKFWVLNQTPPGLPDLDYGLELGSDCGQKELDDTHEHAERLREMWHQHWRKAVESGASIESATSRRAREVLDNLLGVGGAVGATPKTLVDTSDRPLDSLHGCLDAWHQAMQGNAQRLQTWLAELRGLADSVRTWTQDVVARPAWLAEADGLGAATRVRDSLRQRWRVVDSELGPADGACLEAARAAEVAVGNAAAAMGRTLLYAREWGGLSRLAGQLGIGHKPASWLTGRLTWWRVQGEVRHWLECHVADLGDDRERVEPQHGWAATDRRRAYCDYVQHCARQCVGVPDSMPNGLCAKGIPDGQTSGLQDKVEATRLHAEDCGRKAAALHAEMDQLRARMEEINRYIESGERVRMAETACGDLRQRVRQVEEAAAGGLGANWTRVQHAGERLDALRGHLADLASGRRVGPVSEHETIDPCDVGAAVVDDMEDLLCGLADNAYKPVLFHLASRWHEGVFVEKNGAEHKGNGRDGVEGRYRVLAHVFPIMVTTLAALARRVQFFSAFDHVGIGLVDMLLIDEAGQATPELGGMGLLCSKLCVAVGDAKQIRPIWGIDKTMDWPLARTRLGLPNTEDAYGAFGSATWTCHRGSALEMVQDHTPWAPMAGRGLERGLWLREHVRCPVEIISLCDELLYNRTLKYSIASFFEDAHGGMAHATALSSAESDGPISRMSYRRGRNRSVDSGGWPGQPLLFVSCDGKSNAGGSRTNPEEARTILEWLDTHCHRWCGDDVDAVAAGKLSNAFAILSPFRGQADLVRRLGRGDGVGGYEFKNPLLRAYREQLFAVRRRGAVKGDGDEEEEAIAVEPIIVGTVHSLQGAEIDIVAFSSVYGTNDTGARRTFIDDTPQLLNVALSRAKRTFILFGNRRFLGAWTGGAGKGKPIDVLCKHFGRFGMDPRGG